MLCIDKKYFGLVSRLERVDTDKPMYHFSCRFQVKGLHIYIHKIYFSLYIRLGLKRERDRDYPY